MLQHIDHVNIVVDNLDVMVAFYTTILDFHVTNEVRIEGEWLEDDNKLVMAGKTFRRVEGPVPGEAVPRVCVRLPGPGRIGVLVLHDRDSNHRFNYQRDGIGFSRNPALGLSQPRASAVAINVGPGVTSLRVVMNYRTGILSFGPLPGVR